AQTILQGDGVHPAVEYPRGSAPYNCGAWDHNSNWCANDGPADQSDFLHNEGDVVVFWDGHAKWLSYGTVHDVWRWHYFRDNADPGIYCRANAP
ncbi:MAG: hypothetical protein ACE5O2_13785, partial [Armatimonadota bacterium]